MCHWEPRVVGLGLGPALVPEVRSRRRAEATVRSDDLVDADAAAGAAGLVDLLQRVLGGLDALSGLTLQRLVVRVAGGQRAALGLLHEVLRALSQGNHSSVVRISGNAGVNPPWVTQALYYDKYLTSVKDD